MKFELIHPRAGAALSAYDFGPADQLVAFAHADLGLEIHITELDIALDSGDPSGLATQGDLYRKIAVICLQNPNCRVLQTWGFTDKYSWLPGYSKGKQGWALPFDAAYRRKPAYDRLRNALQSK